MASDSHSPLKEKGPHIFGFPRNIFFLGLTSLFNDFSSEMIFAAFPAFFTSVLHAGAASLGLVDGVAEAASNFGKIWSGRLSDRIQKRKLLVIAGYTFSVVTRPFYMLTGTVTGVLGLRFLDRVGKGMRDAPRDSLISLSTPKAEMGKSFGYHRTMDAAGAVLGPLAAYLMLRFFPGNFNALFMTAFFIGIIAVATLAFITDVSLSTKGERIRFIDSLKHLPGRFKLFLLAVFILAAGSLPVAVMLLKTQSIGLLIADIPLFYMLYSISYAGFSIPAGKMSDKLGTHRIILLGYILLFLAYGVIAFAHSAIVLALGFLILGLFPACTDGVQRALASSMTKEEVRGGALGLLTAASGFGALVAGIGGGFMWQAYGPLSAFLAGGAVVILGLFTFLISSWTPRERSRI